MRAQRTACKAADGCKNTHLHVHGTTFEKVCRGKGGAAGGAELVGGIGVVGRQPGEQIGRQTDQPAAAGCRIHKACKAGHQHEKRHHPRRDRDTHCYNSSYLSKSFVLFQGTRALDHIKPPLAGQYTARDTRTQQGISGHILQFSRLLLQIVFKEAVGVAPVDGFHLVLGKALAAQCLGQQRHICRRFQLVLTANAVKVAAKTDDLNAAHLLEVCRVLCQRALARTTKQKARLDRYEKLKNMEKTRRPDQMDPIVLKTRLGKPICDIEHLEFYFDERPMIKDFTYHVVRHDRIGIVGPNGVGKSTFMNILDGTYEATRGTIGKGETVRIAHFKQELPEFDEDMRVLDYIREDHSYMVLGDGSTLSAGQILERFLFTPELHGVPIRKLSGGERRRLYLLKLLMSAPNVLLLDEPTNDLDIPTLEVLEDFLDSFSGVIITVCHDRYFLDRVVDKLFVFTGDGHIEIVHGSYSDYKDALDESSGSKRPFYMPNDNIPANSKVVRAVVGGEADSDDSVDNQSNRVDTLGNDNVVAGDKTDTFKEILKKGLNKAEEAEYAKIMDELPKLEHLVKGLDVMISQVATDYEKMQSLMEEREETQAQIDALTERWMELEERL